MDGQNPRKARAWLDFHHNKHQPHTPIDQPHAVDKLPHVIDAKHQAEIMQARLEAKRLGPGCTQAELQLLAELRKFQAKSKDQAALHSVEKGEPS
jgi:hypothetical protein